LERGRRIYRMKRWFILIGILGILLIGAYFALTFYAVKFIQPYLQKVAWPGFTLGEIKVKATHLSALGIQYEEPHSKQRFLQIMEIRVYPSLLSPLKKSLHIKELTLLQPSFFIYRSREEGIAGPWVTVEKEREGKEVSKEERKKEREPFQIRIDRIRIQKGSIDFEDGKVSPPTHIKLRELDFEIKDIRYPLASLHCPIALEGKMEGMKQEGRIDAKGWVDLKTMDLETLIRIRNIEVKTFEPYYRKRVTAEIESGHMDLDSNVTVKEKRIDAPGELDIVHFHIKEGGGAVFWIPAETLIPLLEKKKNEVRAPFHVKGNLGDPKFSLQETLLMGIGFSFMEALGFPVKGLAEGFFGEPEKGMEGLKSLEELFRKKKERKRRSD
jgi:Domain of Unknown Function (DUF748)